MTGIPRKGSSGGMMAAAAGDPSRSLRNLGAARKTRSPLRAFSRPATPETTVPPSPSKRQARRRANCSTVRPAEPAAADSGVFGMSSLVHNRRQLGSPEQDDQRERDPEQEKDDRGQCPLDELGEDDSDGREVRHIKGEYSFKDLPWDSADDGRHGRAPGENLDL